jgi:hypothetical protein
MTLTEQDLVGEDEFRDPEVARAGSGSDHADSRIQFAPFGRGLFGGSRSPGTASMAIGQHRARDAVFRRLAITPDRRKPH